ncbi:MAG: hypothetical protein RJA22_1745 [Verrucomicrobiota bacterium]
MLYRRCPRIHAVAALLAAGTLAAVAGPRQAASPIADPAPVAEFAAAVVAYEPGVGAASRFFHPEAALGAPSTHNPFGEETDPFNPPYGTNQIVSLGAGGRLILQFAAPILNHPHNPHGLDFTIFGNAGFIITNDFNLDTFEWVGVPATDGSLFGVNFGETRVSVSLNGRDYFLLNPALAPVVDGPLPSDGIGEPRRAIPPGTAPEQMAGATLADLREQYAGSAGGAGYDIGWAVDAGGRPVHLPAIRYVRVEVLSGRSEVDAVAAAARPAGPGAGRLR